jgi:hypothetical protein
MAGGMKALEFWKATVADQSDFLLRLVRLLEDQGVRYCVIGGQAVNAYVEPLVSLDLDVAVAADDLPKVEEILGGQFTVQRFPHSLNVAEPGSDLRVQVQLDPRYQPFVAHAQLRDVLGLRLPVAAVGDVLRGKVWAALDPAGRPSKRQKDLADISRLLERFADLRSQVPQEILDRLL